MEIYFDCRLSITAVKLLAISEYYNELTNTECKKYNTDEFNSLRDTFCTRFQNECKSELKNNVDLQLSSKGAVKIFRK